MKRIINESVAHSNIIYSSQNFKVNDTKGLKFELPFFDHFDEYKVKSDLWLIANTALGILDLFNGVNQKYKVFQFISDFFPRYKALAEQNHQLKEKLKKDPRYLATIQ